MAEIAAIRRIVVGVDGSPASLAALRWAAAETRLRHSEIMVVRAWRPSSEILAPYAPVLGRPTTSEERQCAEAELTAAVLEVFGPTPDVKVHHALVHGATARVLLEQSVDADLVVLGGHHAHTPLTHTVGAINAACLRHVTCPVVIVTPPAPGVTRAQPVRQTASPPQEREIVDSKHSTQEPKYALH